MDRDPILSIQDLTVDFKTKFGTANAVDRISFSLRQGERLGIVGESGSGKSVICKTILQLLPDYARIGGAVKYGGKNILHYNNRQMYGIRGKEISMIFQEPMTSLNPLYTIGNQLMETIILHQGASKAEAEARAVEMLKLVSIPQADERLKQYPFELSGGMRQRVMIAMALSCNPKILIADEPTTALDVTIQAQILELIRDLNRKLSTALILITHDLGVVANIADRIVVMYAGQIVERGTSIEVFHHPRHPYTNALLEAVPRLDLQNKQQLASIEGTPPDLIAPPKGCPFCTRCKYCMEICCEQQPPVLNFGDGHEASCWLYQLETPAADAPFTQEAHYEG